MKKVRNSECGVRKNQTAYTHDTKEHELGINNKGTKTQRLAIHYE